MGEAVKKCEDCRFVKPGPMFAGYEFAKCGHPNAAYTLEPRYHIGEDTSQQEMRDCQVMRLDRLSEDACMSWARLFEPKDA